MSCSKHVSEIVIYTHVWQVSQTEVISLLCYCSIPACHQSPLSQLEELLFRNYYIIQEKLDFCMCLPTITVKNQSKAVFSENICKDSEFRSVGCYPSYLFVYLKLFSHILSTSYSSFQQRNILHQDLFKMHIIVPFPFQSISTSGQTK